MSFPIWLEIAAREMGQKEISGINAHNPRILEYHKTTTLKATQDEVPWCSSFVNWCISNSGIEGTNSAAAASWGGWGASIQPRVGALVLLRFDTATNPSGAHVGFVWWTDHDKLIVLGGNQRDEVNLTSFKRTRVLAYKWPTHWAGGLPMNDLGRKIV
ncbi:MAG: hypothetical protein BWZ03_00081 [bacterium ADurb.BinA186]|nr:MAG: hypothetical protein BWZ03_00081 [bacterium ADurb.BinA186]